MLDFVFATHWPRATTAQIQKRQEERAVAWRAYLQRLHDEYIRDMKLGGAILGGIVIVGALGNAGQKDRTTKRDQPNALHTAWWAVRHPW